MKLHFSIDTLSRIALGALCLAIVGDLTVTLVSGTHFQTNVFAAKRAPEKRTEHARNSFFKQVSLELDGVQLIDFLDRYSKLYDFDFFLDRRVDPTKLVSCSVSKAPLIDAFDAAFSNANLSFCVVDNSFLYVGPEDSGAEAQLLFQIKRSELELGGTPQTVVQRLTSTIDFQIAPYAEPSDIFQSLARRAQIKCQGFDALPFDRWRAASFENVAVANLITIFALGFNAEFQYDSEAKAVKPTPIDRARNATLLYDSKTTAELDRSQFRNCTFQDEGATTRITGAFEELMRVEAEIAKTRRQAFENEAKLDAQDEERQDEVKRPKPRASSRSGKALVSGAVVNKPLRDVFAYLEKNSGILCELDPSMETAGVTLDTRVTCEFKNADARKIGNAIATKIGARAQIDGATITFVKK